MANILVQGSGPIGLCLVQAVCAYGADQVYCSDIVDTPLRITGEVGVDVTMNARTVDICDKVMNLTNGRGVDVVFDNVENRNQEGRSAHYPSVCFRLIRRALPLTCCWIERRTVP